MLTEKDALTEQFASFLSTLLAQGFETPIHWIALAVNGTVIAGRYDAEPDGSLKATLTAQHMVGRGFALPINFVYVDQRGEAARFVIARDGRVEVLN